VRQYIQANIAGAWTEGVEIDRVACRVQWEFQQFREQELDPDDDVLSVLTISGRVKVAEASPCGAYMRQTWPGTGEKLLEAFIALSKHNSCGKPIIYLEFGWLTSLTSLHIQHSAEHSVSLERRRASKTIGEGVDVEVRGKPAKIVETLEQLAWLVAALRRPSAECSLSVSHVEFRIASARPESQHIQCDLFPLPLQAERNSLKEMGACWIPLFQKSVLAWGFPARSREEGVGLELPFHLMATMAGIRYPIEFQGGIILKSKSETIFPVANLTCGIQWHRVEGEGTKEFLATVKSFPQWYQTKDLGSLTTARTFLGLFSHAHVSLGTTNSNIAPSEVPKDKKWIAVGEQIPLNLTLRLPWIASFGVTPTIVLPKSQRKQITNEDIGYEQSLQRSSQTPLLFYDAGTRIG
jgi:hypothetical protein